MSRHYRMGRLALPAVALLAIAPLSACSTGVMDLEVGDCFDASALEGADEVSTVDTVDCSEEHTGEVFGSLEHAESETAPALQDLFDEADEHCYYEFQSFVGVPYEESAHEYYVVSPTQESWENADDRTSLCLLVSEPVSGSLENSGT